MPKASEGHLRINAKYFCRFNSL